MIENTRLVNELRQLRKGSGMQPWKLQHMTVLRKKIAMCLSVDPTLLSMGQMYTQLLYELGELGEGNVTDALRNAYAIGRETNPRDLTSRRLDFALRIGRHADTVKAYEDQAISRLAHRLQNRGAVTPSSRSEKSGGEAQIVTDALRRTVAEGLSGLYSLGIHSMEVLQILGRNHYPYLNANVTCVLAPSFKGREWFAYHFSYTFSFTKTTFRIGVVKTLQDSSILAASGLFDEVACVSEEAFASEIALLLTDWHFTAVQGDTKLPLKFKEVDAFESQQLLESLWQIDSGDCRIIEVAIPPEMVANSPLYCFETTTHLPVGQCAYWEAPGLMYINTITLDVRQFPKHEKREFHLKPFLGVAYTSALQPIQGKYILPVHSWITHGHGVMVVWQEKGNVN